MSKQASRTWAKASRDSLVEQKHLMSSAVSLLALNPLVWPAVLLAWLLKASKHASEYPIVRTLLYLLAVLWTHIVIYSIRAVTPLCFVYAGIILSFTVGLLRTPVWLQSLLPTHSIFGCVALTYTLVEVVFYLYTLRRARTLQRRVTGPELGIARRWLCYRRVETSAPFVLPMPMPRSCVYWRMFKHLREPATVELVSPSGRRIAAEPRSDDSYTLGDVSPHHYNERTSPDPEDGHPLEFLRGWFYNIPLKHIRHDNLMVFFAESQYKCTPFSTITRALLAVSNVLFLLFALSCRLHGHASARAVLC
jgi:hypothetical protein